MTLVDASRMSRRRFLASGAATAAALGTLPDLLHADDSKPYGDFIIGTQSYSFRRFNTEQALKRTHDLGLHYVEFYQKHAPIDGSSEQIQALLRLCHQYDITPVAYGVQAFTQDHERNKKSFEFGKALGIKAFSADPDPKSFDSLDKLVDEYKIAIAIHPHGPSGGGRLHRWYSAEAIMKAVKDHHELIGSCLDTGHLIRAAQLGKKLDPAEQIHVMGPRNFGVHLKDHDNQQKTDVVFGKGALDVPGVLKALRDVKFKGHISLEYEANEANPSPDMQACLIVLKEGVKNLA
jgi:inosose dehydratase